MKCCDMTAGMLREPVTFQELVITDIGGGANERSFVDRTPGTKGKFEPLSGGERLYAQRLDAETRNRLTIRYRADITESDRVKVRDRYYNIRHLQNVEFLNRWLVIDLDGGVAL